MLYREPVADEGALESGAAEDSSTMPYMLIAFVLLAGGIAGFIILGRRKRDNE